MLDLFGIPGGALAEYRQARTGVFAAFVVVGGGGQQVAGEGLQALLIGRMEICQRRTELLGTETHIVARQQHRRTIERGVFHSLGGGGRGQLLEAHAGMLEHLARAAHRAIAPGLATEPLLQVVEHRPVAFVEGAARTLHGLLEHLVIVRTAALGADIGAVHREMHDQFLQGPANGAQGQVAAHDVVAGNVQQCLGHA